ncbi:hypothetical protein BB560_001910 [Smittium megazygosporum]|uniref:U1-type domain-containing protein n=1 Tax=Smittium megazygosporum TaxID=133381 RepID=A0A2T9ZGC1_9FUNG|nr:hypothetical protein BB560_001910 [Smittium megazygosporum]
MSSESVYKGSATDSGFRKTWDKDEYEKRARERARKLKEELGETKAKPKKENEEQVERMPLKARKEKIDLERMVGKTQIIQVSGIASKQPGYYCKVCDCTMRDNISYLDHINGKKHQRNNNMSLKLERESVSQVKNKLEALKRKLAAKSQSAQYDFETAIEENKNKNKLKNEAVKIRRKKAKLENNSKEKESQETNTLDDQGSEIASLMG